MVTQTRGSAAERRGKSGPKKASRTSPALYFRQVVAELRRVIWPTRRDLITYTTVVLVFVLVMVGIVTGMDYAFTKLVLGLFG
ncbi:MAG TPA: preprotein translocase subunit SecE [Streptosporangiaceae bacterium]|nr:preprotein translocase subunit SecE [Streptosporangiaceae bacterium]